MIQLTVNYSQRLFELIQAGQAPVQGIEFSPWFTPAKITELRGQLPGLAFHFHHGNLLARLKWDGNAAKDLSAYLACTETPWVSAHLSMLQPGIAWLARHTGWYLPAADGERSYPWLVAEIKKLGKLAGLAVLMENMPALPKRRYLHEVDPERIGRVLEETDVGLLLDLPHARTAAHILGIGAHEYIERLPLERTRQIHVSGPRMKGQALVDAHEPLQAEDYALLEWALERTNPQVVTLEYYKEKQPLAEQLARLARMLS